MYPPYLPYLLFFRKVRRYRARGCEVIRGAFCYEQCARAVLGSGGVASGRGARPRSEKNKAHRITSQPSERQKLAPFRYGCFCFVL